MSTLIDNLSRFLLKDAEFERQHRVSVQILHEAIWKTNFIFISAKARRFITRRDGNNKTAELNDANHVSMLVLPCSHISRVVSRILIACLPPRRENAKPGNATLSLFIFKSGAFVVLRVLFCCIHHKQNEKLSALELCFVA